MGYTILSLVIFAISLYIFFITNKKVQAIKDESISSEMRQEMDALITEFNRTATRNIELLEDKIDSLEKLMAKADKRVLQLDERIGRANRPIVVEKIVEKKAGPKKNDQIVKEPAEEKTAIRDKPKDDVVSDREIQEAGKTGSRSDQLKQLMREGKSEQELLDMGYQMNEIKLLRFLIK